MKLSLDTMEIAFAHYVIPKQSEGSIRSKGFDRFQSFGLE
jgi:hypothetical protein